MNIIQNQSILNSDLEEASFNPLLETPEVLSKISLDSCPFPVKLPQNFQGRHMRDSEELVDRVAVHREAFNPSRVSEESYLNVMNTYPYDPSLDWVIESPSGEFVDRKSTRLNSSHVAIS